MIDILKAVILGIVEGITEFLPISSTGHLILVNQWITFSEEFANVFNIVIQFGAILAVLVLFRKKLLFWGEGIDARQRDKTMALWLKTFVGILPAIVLGVLFLKTIQEKLFNPFTVALALIGWGIVLILIERQKIQVRMHSTDELTFRTAFLIGIIQCLAFIPGTSRSAATIIGAMLLGTSRTVAAEFSFFLAIPTMLAASVYTLFSMGFVMTPHEAVILAVGFIVSFLVALVVVKGLMRYISKHDFKPFGYYRIIIGLLVLLMLR